MYTTSKDLYSLGQICCLIESNQGLFPAADLLHVLEWYRLSFSSLLCKLIKRRDVAFFGVCEADNKEEIGVQVAVIESAGRMSCVCVFTQKDDIRSSVFDQYLCKSVSGAQRQLNPTHACRILNTGVVFNKSD